MTIFWKILLIYLALMNLLGFLFCGADKYKAQRRRWRIPEKTLFTLSGLGGCFGFLLGMLLFRHKTRHWSFRLAIPLFCVLWAVGILLGVLYL